MKKAIFIIVFAIMLTSCGSPDKKNLSSSTKEIVTEPDPNELTPHNKELTELAINAIDDYLNGKSSKQDANDKLMSLFKSYDIEGLLVDAEVAECAMYVIDEKTDKVLQIRNKLASMVDMDDFAPAAKISNEDIDKIILITNTYLLGEKSNDAAAAELMDLLNNLEKSGIGISSDMKMLYTYISTSPDPKENKKEIMKYRNNIAILKED